GNRRNDNRHDRNGQASDNRRFNDRSNDRRNGNRNDRRQDNRPGRDGQGQTRGGQDRRQDNRQAQAGPRIDFKARAAALKAEQNTAYSAGSEERYKQELAAKEAKRQAQARKSKVDEVVTDFVEPEVIPTPQPVAAPMPVAEKPVDNRRKKQGKHDKSRDFHQDNEDGPRNKQTNKNRNNQQVRNQRNSNWNNTKKNKRGNKNQAQKPVTERKFHELPTEFEYTAGMTVAEIAKRIKREPAEIVKKLFMMGVMAT
ncbi:translation initiation factor IF-2 N-terminal domain-containing protein, partial [Enterococcus faecalis]|nr:translation initiation factor IF-2 N-terminal domain-containing protein [Enterococcus faecalis]